ncbi:MAG: sensor histidine kinase [Bacteroidaceae bacterium]|nr:sensor histidine kinase [Bacteroidaceae bacterium]
MKQHKIHLARFALSLSLLVSLLIVTFVSLAYPGFAWWSVGVALLANLPLAYLFVWLAILLARWLSRKPIPTWLRYLAEIGAMLWLFLIMRELHVQVLSPFISFPVDLSRMLLPALVFIVMFTLFVELFLYQQRLNAEAEEKANYQRMMLRRQMAPHFLFNSLNVLASLTYRDPETANLFTKRLARIYRYILDTEDKPSVPLADELRFVESYVYLQHIRYGEAVGVDIRGSERSGEAHNVVPGSIQQLVENAIKHNTATLECPLRIVVELGEEGVTVSNNRQPRTEVMAHGTGLHNLRQQLHHFGHTLHVTDSPTAFTVSLPYV